MPGATNLWELAAVVEANFSQSDRAMDQNARKVDTLTAKYNQLDKANNRVGGSNNKLGQAFSGLSQTITSTGGPLNNMIGQYGGLISAGGRLSASAGGVGVAIGLVTLATVGAVAGIYSLTTASAELTGKFIDLSQQTGYNVETLSALGNALETSGGNLDTAVNSLIKFETEMVAAREEGSEMSKIFKILNIDTRDHELALRQALSALQGMTDQELKATVGKKLFGKSVKDMLGAIAEAGSLDAYLNQQLAEGTLITTKAAKQGDELSDTVAILNRRFQAGGRIIAEEFTPMVVDGLRTLSKWLVDNQDEIRDTAKAIADLTRDIKSLAEFIWSISPIRLEIQIIRKVLGSLDFGGDDPNKPVVSSGPGGQSMFDRFWDYMTNPAPTGPGAGWGRVDMSKVQPQTAAQIAATAQANADAAKAAADARKKQADAEKKLNDTLTGRGGGGGGGGRRSDPLREQKQFLEASLRSTLENLEGEERGVKRSYEQRRLAVHRYFTASMSLEGKRHEAVIETLNAEIELAKKIKDPRERQLALLDLGTQKQREMTRHAEEEARLLNDVKNTTRERIVLVETLVSRLTREREVLKQIRQERTRFKSEVEREDLGGGSFVLTPEERDRIQRSGRVVTTDETVRREREAIFRERMENVAADITTLIDDSITEGFRNGIKAGVVEFGLGILEMAKHEALKKLQKAIADALFGGLNPDGEGGGGGIFAKLLGWVITGIAGGIGVGGGGASAGGIGAAAGSGIGNFAEGGYMKPFEWSWVGERGPELVKAGRQGVTVMNNEDSMQMAGNTFHITMPIHVPNMAAAGTRDTQHQVRRALAESIKAVTLKG